MKHKTYRISLTLIVVVALSGALYKTAAALKFSEWSAPVNLGLTINSASLDAAPAPSKNGLSLYFTSNRPGGSGGLDIWVSQRASVDEPWGPPENLGPNINTGSAERVPSFSRDGHSMFFVSNRPGGSGGDDIWVSWRAHTQDDFGWQPPVNLGAGVNSAAGDAGASYFENEDTGVPQLYFTSNRPGGPGGFDIYVSELGADGFFGPAVLVAELSSPQSDQRPAIRHDGLEMFISSDRPGTFGLIDLWVSTRETTLEAWSTPVNLGSIVNSAFVDIAAAVSSHREILFFGSDRPGGSGLSDLYMTTRTKMNGQ